MNGPRFVDPAGKNLPTAYERAMQRAMISGGIKIGATWSESSGGYNSGSITRPQMQGWTPFPTAADTANYFGAKITRGRSRDLVRNAPLATGAVNTMVTSVVGTGLQYHSRVDREALGWDIAQADKWQRTTEREFRLWALRECDVSRQQTFYQMQDLAFRSMLESGDVFALLPMHSRPGAAYKTRIQLIEADRVANPGFTANTKGRYEGIDFDADTGCPKTYHIMNRHPGEFMRFDDWKWTEIPAFGEKTGRRNVVHLFRRMRPGETRGVGFLAPVVEALRQLARYTEAEITAAVVSGMYALFVESNADGFADFSTSSTSPAPPSGQIDSLQLAPGIIADLAPGEKVTSHNPGRPNTAFDPFVQAILRQIGVALEIPFEILVKHFTASYSAARGALIEAWRTFMARREFLATTFCDPILEVWMDEAVSIGRIEAHGYFDDPMIRAAYLGSEWTGDGMGSLNPLQEANAKKTMIEANLTTHAKQISADGGDWREVFEQRKIERDFLFAAGLLPDTPVPIAPVTGATDDAPEKQEEE